MRAVGIIPSRLESTRLPRKALIDIDGLPMIVHVFKRTALSDALDEVYVATDSEVIFDIVTRHGGHALMTSDGHRTGTDRIAEAASHIDADIIVNIQGDEPLLNPRHIGEVVAPLQNDPTVQVAVLVSPFTARNRLAVIKAVLDQRSDILYCSRNDLPSSARVDVGQMWKMSFIVPFRKDFLLRYASWDQSPLERIEFNEYLRILEHGFKIRAVPVAQVHISVDTYDDLRLVRDTMKTDSVRERY